MTRLACPLVVGLVLIVSGTAGGGKFNRVLTPGDPAPVWTGLKGVDGRKHSLATLKDARAVLLVFLSNRCPMTRAYEQRLIAQERGQCACPANRADIYRAPIFGSGSRYLRS